MKTPIKTTKSVAAILTVTAFLTATLCGCGQKEGPKSESKPSSQSETSDSDAKTCVTNMKKFLQATLSVDHDKALAFIDEWAWQLGKGHYATKPQCPSGTPYFICDLSDYNLRSVPTQDKVLAYCAKHHTVLLSSQRTKECSKTEFELFVGAQLLNTNDVAAVLCQKSGVWEKKAGSRSVESSGGKSARQLITDFAKGRHGRRADVLIESGFYGGAYQVTVKVPIQSGAYEGGYDSFTYTATVNEKTQEVTSWQLTDHN